MKVRAAGLPRQEIDGELVIRKLADAQMALEGTYTELFELRAAAYLPDAER